MNTDTQNTTDGEDSSPVSAVKKFLFDRSFDEEEELIEEEVEEEVEEAEPEVIVPTFSEEEMKAAREQAFASGKEEGINEAAAATEREIVGILEKLGGKFGEIFKSQEEADASILESAISVAVAITRKVFPTLNERNALKEIERMVTLTMEKILEEPRIIVHVNPELTGPLTERLGGLAEKAGYKGEVEVAAADDMPPGDCRVEWKSSSAIFQISWKLTKPLNRPPNRRPPPRPLNRLPSRLPSRARTAAANPRPRPNPRLKPNPRPRPQQTWNRRPRRRYWTQIKMKRRNRRPARRPRRPRKRHPKRPKTSNRNRLRMRRTHLAPKTRQPILRIADPLIQGGRYG
jgi:flagellar assembly protein FliH